MYLNEHLYRGWRLLVNFIRIYHAWLNDVCIVVHALCIMNSTSWPWPISIASILII